MKKPDAAVSLWLYAGWSAGVLQAHAFGINLLAGLVPALGAVVIFLVLQRTLLAPQIPANAPTKLFATVREGTGLSAVPIGTIESPPGKVCRKVGIPA